MDDRTKKILGWIQVGLGVAPLVLQIIQAINGGLMDHSITAVSAANVAGGLNHVRDTK